MDRSSSCSRVRVGVAALLFLTIAGFYWKLTLTSQYEWMAGPDIAEQVLPWFEEQAREIHHGRLPLWDPYLWSGQPLSGNGQPGTAYPLNWILFALPLQNGHIAPGVLAWYYVAIHLMAAAFAYLFCRDLRRSRTASFAGGLTFSLSGFLGDTDWPQMMNGAVWAPLVFLFQLRGGVGNAALSGMFLGLAFLSGHHQVPIFIALAWIGVWIWLCLRDRRVLRAAALAIVIAALTSALQTIPAWEFGRLARRWVGAPQPIEWNQPVPYSVHEHYDLKPFSFFGIVFPGVHANFDPFIGVVALTLAMLAVSAAWKDPRVRLLAAVAGGALLYALGHNSIFQGVLYALLPGIDKARVPSAAVLVFQCATAALAAFGVDQLESAWTRTARRCLVLFGALTLSVSLWLLFTNEFTFPGDDRVILTGVIALLMAAALLRPAPIAIVLLLLFELGNYAQIHLAPRNDRARMATLDGIRGNPEMAAWLRAQAGFPRAEVAENLFAPNWGAYHGVEMHGGFGAAVTVNVLESDYFTPAGRRQWGVQYVIAKSPPADGGEEVVATSDGLKLYRRPDARSRAWAIHAQPCGAPDRVELIEHDADRLAIRADLACDGTVILSDTFYPGWRARVDHRPAEIAAANGAMRAVAVPRGNHTVTMRYRPASVYLGAALTLLGIGAALLIARRKLRCEIST